MSVVLHSHSGTSLVKIHSTENKLNVRASEIESKLDVLNTTCSNISGGGGGGGGGDSSEAKQLLMISKLEEVNDKLPVDLEVDGSNSLRVVGRFVGNINHREIDTTIDPGGSASVNFGTSGFRTINVYGAIDPGNTIFSMSGMTTISVETSRDNITWFHYKDISIDTMKGGNRNSIADTITVISPQMRITINNTDLTVSRPVKLYVQGIKSRD
jgi:hypothetical protein